MDNDNEYYGMIGKQIGNYRVVAELGTGAFGRVYKGEHLFLTQRAVAIKLLHTVHLSSSQEKEGFLQEARFLEMIRHPYILPVLDVGLYEGLPYLVADYAPRGSLRDRLKQAATHLLPVQEALTIVIQMGEALAHAHRQQIIHRDLKPENILFNGLGDAMLADFGVATMLGTASIKYSTIIGTPPYMAPEQFQGVVSKESDQYALGCIAYELFTGTRPFNAPDIFAMGFKHLSEAPVPPTQLNPQLPTPIEEAILRAMAKRREDRYPDVLSFIAPFRAFSTHTIHPMHPIAPTGPELEGPTKPFSLFPTAVMDAPTFLSSDAPTMMKNLPQTELPVPVTGQGQQTFISTGKTANTNNTANTANTGSATDVPLPLLDIHTSKKFPAFVDIAVDMAQQPTNVVAPSAAPTPPGTAVTMPAISPSRQKRREKRKGLIVVFLILLLGTGGTLYAFTFYGGFGKGHTTNTTNNHSTGGNGQPVKHVTQPPPVVSANVTITPVSNTLQKTYTITAVTGTLNAASKQVQAQVLSSTQGPQTNTVNATGQGTTTAQQAQGTLSFPNPLPVPQTWNAGSVFTDNYGISVALDTTLTVPPSSAGTVAATAVNAGASGNIAAGDTFQIGDGRVATSVAAFTGGADAKAYSYVKQADIDSAASSLVTSLTQSAQTAVQNQISANASTVGSIRCWHNTTADQAVNDVATTVTVNVTATCSVEVYDEAGAKSMAAHLIESDAASNGFTVTASAIIAARQVTNVAGDGTITLTVNASVQETYHFTDALKQHYAQLIAGKSKQDALSLLQQQSGVSSASITITGGDGNTLPTDPTKITIGL